MYPYSLRPIVAITSLLGIIWGVAMGVACIRGRNDDSKPVTLVNLRLTGISDDERETAGPDLCNPVLCPRRNRSLRPDRVSHGGFEYVVRPQ